MGGSTTECLFLDQSEAWPFLLEQMLNEKLNRSDIWVGNVGRSGRSTRDHILQAEKLLAQYPRIDVVILLIGVNDMTLRLAADTDYRPLADEPPDYHQRLLEHAFSRAPGRTETLPFHKRTELWRRLRTLKQSLLATDVQDQAGRAYARWRRHRRRAIRFRHTLPDLSTGLKAYSQNVRRIIDSVQGYGAHVVLITQPSMWRSDLPIELEHMLWLGRVGIRREKSGNEYYTAGALAKAMDMYNQQLLRVCGQQSVQCIDIAPRIAKDAQMFYDDVHFNEQGSREIAKLLAEYFVSASAVPP